MAYQLDGEAEAAVAGLPDVDVRPDRGVAYVLLLPTGDQALEVFTGEVLGENRRMLALAAIFAETTYTLKDGLYHVRMTLRGRATAAYTARTLRRAA